MSKRGEWNRLSNSKILPIIGIFICCCVLWMIHGVILIDHLDEQNDFMPPNGMIPKKGTVDHIKAWNVLEEVPDKQKYDICVVGAGLSGTIFAERHSTLFDNKVLLIDVRDHVGGNCYDYTDEQTGILMNKYGAHLFHTNEEKAYRYITMHKNAPKWIRWDHKVVGWIGGKLVPIPVTIETVNSLLNLNIQTEEEMRKWLKSVQIPCDNEVCHDAEEMAKSRVGPELFELIFKDYTKKQWDKDPKELDALVTARIPVRDNFDARYFSDKYQVLPSQGYTKWFEALLFNKRNIDIVLDTNYFDVKEKMDTNCRKTIYTGPIDHYFIHKQKHEMSSGLRSSLETLEYRSIDFVEERFYNIDGYRLPNSVVNYPEKEYPFTRIVEYKHFLHQKSKHTITIKEYSKSEGDPYYPVPNPRNLELYAKYKSLAEEEEKTKKVLFVGRLANYKYFNMDAAIVNALDLFYESARRPVMKGLEDLYP